LREIYILKQSIYELDNLKLFKQFRDYTFNFEKMFPKGQDSLVTLEFLVAHEFFIIDLLLPLQILLKISLKIIFEMLN
jgi:hypothetical protein